MGEVEFESGYAGKIERETLIDKEDHWEPGILKNASFI
jgi:hypothetical protein